MAKAGTNKRKPPKKPKKAVVDADGKPLLHKKLTPEQSGMLRAFALCGIPFDVAANHLHMSVGALQRLLIRIPELGDIYKRAREEMITTVGKRLYQKAMDGDTVAMMFLLKTQGHWKENHDEQAPHIPLLGGKTFTELYIIKHGVPPSPETLAYLDKAKLKEGDVTLLIPAKK